MIIDSESIRNTEEFKILLNKSIYDMTNTELVLFEVGGGSDNMTSDLASELAIRVDNLVNALAATIHQLTEYSDNSIVYSSTNNEYTIESLLTLTK